MAVIRQQVDIRRTCPGVWRYVTDFERMPEWFFGVRHVSVLSSKSGVGAERILTTLAGHSYRERFVTWEEPRTFGFQVLNPPWFSRQWDAGIELAPTSDGARIVWEIRYATRFGILGRAFDVCLVAPLMTAVVRRSLKNLRAVMKDVTG
jgi:polyketide cyclase/dehydrase/lipid transport protein